MVKYSFIHGGASPGYNKPIDKKTGKRLRVLDTVSTIVLITGSVLSLIYAFLHRATRRRFLLKWSYGYGFLALAGLLWLASQTGFFAVTGHFFFLFGSKCLAEGAVEFSGFDFRKFYGYPFWIFLVAITVTAFFVSDISVIRTYSLPVSAALLSMGGVALILKKRSSLVEPATGLLFLLFSAILVLLGFSGTERHEPLLALAALLAFAGSMGFLASYFVEHFKVLEESRRELISSRRYLESLLKTIDGLVFSFDREGVCVDCFAPESIGGVPEEIKPVHLLGRRFSELLPGDFSMLMEEALEKARTSAETQRFHYSIEFAERELWFYCTVTPRYDDEGSVNGFTVLSRDFTEVKISRLEVEKRELLLKASGEITNELLQKSDIDEAVGKALEILGRATGVSRVYIFNNHYDETGKVLLASQRYEWTDGTVESQIASPSLQNVSYTDVIPRWFRILSDRGVVMGDVESFPVSEREILEPQGIVSVLVLPIHIGENFWGFIGFDECRYGREWFDGEVSVLKSVAGVIARTAEMRTTQKQVIISKERLEKLHDIAIEMAKAVRPYDIYCLIVQAITDILESPLYSLCIREGNDFRAVLSSESEIIEQPVLEGRGILLEAFLKGETIYTEDVSKSNLAKPSSQKIRSAITLPISGIGVLQISSAKKKGFTGEDITFAQLLLSHAVEAIKRIEYEEEIRFMGLHDKLTGLANRRYFDDKLIELDSIRLVPVSLIMVDVNGLKLVNDAYGHTAGDSLLQKVAVILQISTRRDDIVCRLGGDEFAVILPGEDERAVSQVVSRIRATAVHYKEEAIQISLAIGSSTKKNENQSLSNVVRESEERMYRNKMLEHSSFRSSIMKSLEATLFEKSQETEEHAGRLERLARIVAERLSVSREKIDELLLLARLHDIGKIALPETIFSKSDRLTEDEWTLVKTHPEIGYRIAESIPELRAVAEGILSHHERWGGGGYPRGLKGEEIPIIARIISAIDAYDVMSNGRPYKPPMNREAIVEEYVRESGKQFDPAVVKVLLDVI